MAGERREGLGGAVWVERGGGQQDDCGDSSRERCCRMMLEGQQSHFLRPAARVMWLLEAQKLSPPKN